MPDLRPLLWPRSVAVIGASPNAEIIRGRLLHIMLLREFPGRIYPVTRSHSEVQGLRAYPSIADVPEPVDLAVIVIPAAAVPEALEQCGAHGVKAAIIITSGFAEERGEIGPQRQAQIREIAARHGIVICGPNCEGLVNALVPLAATFSPSLEHVETSLAPDVAGGRPMAVISQSGGISFSYLNRGRPRQLRFTYLISSGNEVNVEGFDYVDFMLDEGRTDIFLMYAESIKSGDRFRAAATKAADAGKPLIVAKVGRSEAGRRAAASHTGSLAGADAAYDAVFRRYGVVRCDDMDEMLDVAAALAFCPLPRGRRVGLLSASGGGAVWMADALSANGLTLGELDPATTKEIDALIPSYGTSQNPVDLTAQAVREVGYARVIDLLRRSPSVDAVVVVGSLASERLLQRDREALARVVAGSDKPVLFCAYTLASDAAIRVLADCGIPAYTSLGSCARALGALADYAEFQARWQRRRTADAGQTIAPDARDRVARQLAAAAKPLTEYEAKTLLAEYGIARPAEAQVADEDAAVAAATRIGLPVALKVQSPDITHKTEAGAVALGLDSESSVRAGYRRVVAAAKAAASAAHVHGVLVQKMAAPGVEMILGVSRDPVFGPIVMLGLGGIYVEVLGDVAFAPAPLDADDVHDLLARLKGRRLLDGVRGQPAADVHALVDVVVRLSRFAADHAEAIAEIDLNPVIVHAASGAGGAGVRTRAGVPAHEATSSNLSIVDALIVPAGPTPARS